MNFERVLVTGATGFIGSNLVTRLLDAGQEVSAVVRKTSDTSTLDKRVKLIVDDEKLDESILAAQPEVCIHLATQFIAAHKPEDLAPLIESNVTYGTRLLEACSQVEGLKFVNVGTIWQHYGARPYSPVSLYGATKQAFADMAQRYAEVKGMDIVTVELSDTYGAGDVRRKLIAVLMDSAVNNKTMQMSPGDQLIFLLHVSDVARALMMAPAYATKEAPSYSLPPLQPMNLKELIALTSKVIDKPISADFTALPYRAREMMSSWQYSPPLPGWKPEVTLEEGLGEIWNDLQKRSEV